MGEEPWEGAGEEHWAWEITGRACNGFWDLARVGVAGSKGQKEIPRKEPLDPGKTTPAAVEAQGTWQELLHQTGDSGNSTVGALVPRPWSSLLRDSSPALGPQGVF